MRKPLFFCVVEGVEAHDPFFKITGIVVDNYHSLLSRNAQLLLGFLHMVSPDVVGEMVRKGESTCLKTTIKFAHAMVQVFGFCCRVSRRTKCARDRQIVGYWRCQRVFRNARIN